MNGCADYAASLAVMGVVALVTGWAISASLRSRGRHSETQSADGRASLFPRFHTPTWIQQSHALLRVLGAEAAEAVINEKSMEGLPFPIGYVADVSDLVVRFNELCIDGVECSKDELYEIALTNLRALEPSFELPADGMEAFRDKKGHAAARALLIPDLLAARGEGKARTVCVVAPSRELLIVFASEDKVAAQKARALYEAEEAASEDRPIPGPVRVTAHGFKKTRWTE